MANVVLSAHTLPFTPNSGIALYDGNAVEGAYLDEMSFSATPPPELTAVAPTHTKETLTFSQPVTVLAPVVTPGGQGSPIVSATSSPAPTQVEVDYRIPRQGRRTSMNDGVN